MNAKPSRKIKLSNRELGAFGEQVVADLLIQKGAAIIARNWRIKEGEIDLIGLNPQGIFQFVEVKTRSSLAFGHPLDSINGQKAHRLQRLALAWLATNRHFGSQYQIDCAAVLVDPLGQHTIDYRSDIL